MKNYPVLLLPSDDCALTGADATTFGSQRGPANFVVIGSLISPNQTGSTAASALIHCLRARATR